MAYNSGIPGREPLRQPGSSGDDDAMYPGQPQHRLNHRVSSLSDMGDRDGPSLATRESLVSIDSRYGSGYERYDEGEIDGATDSRASQFYNPGGSWTNAMGYQSGGAYAAVSSIGGSLSRGLSRGSAKVGRKTGSILGRNQYETIDEESYDLSLLSSAAPMGDSNAPRYDSVPEHEPIAPDFDVSSALGPMGPDQSFMRRMQDLEAKGELLGQGFRPETTLRDEEVLASPTAVSRSLSRALTRRIPSKKMTRAATLKQAGQDEANRRGEIIEVIIEEAAPQDLSNMEGFAISFDESRRSNFAAKTRKTQVFYPQPNWKPFSMRWPYLLILVVISVSLAGMQEALFQMYKDDPVLTFNTPDDVDPGLYFTVKFAPTITAVIYGVLWQFVDFEVRRLEAYYQMSKEGGALAAESINVDYVTAFNLLRPFRALKVGHYAVAISSFATSLAVSLVPTFAAASLVLSPSRQERAEHPFGEKTINFSPIWSRLLTSTLGLCAAMACGLLYILSNRRSGLVADVRGIAGLASMAVASHILMDFKDLDTAKPKDIHHKLKHQRYLLRNSSLTPDDENRVSSHDRDKYDDYNLSENPHPLMLRPLGSIPFIIALLVFMGFVPVFLFTPADVITDKAPWVVTALAVGLKLCWNSLETAVRMMEPYYILSRRHAPSKILALDYTALPFGYLPIKALLNWHPIVFLVGFGTVMAEYLTILVSGLATVDGRSFLSEDMAGNKGGVGHPLASGQETRTSFYLSFAACMFILAYMFVVSSIVFVRRRHPFLPRQPNTIASILAFIHQSKMVWKFVSTSKLTTQEVVEKLDEGTTYGLGWFRGRDGQTHCGIDQEELISDYKHGLNVGEQNQPWNTRWDEL